MVVSFVDFFSTVVSINDHESLFSFPLVLCDNVENRVMKWTKEYYRKYEALPSHDVLLKELDDAELVLTTPSKKPVEQLLAEAKRVNCNREINREMTNYLSKENPDIEETLKSINKFKGAIRDSSFVNYDEIEFVVKPARYKFKYATLQNASKGLLGGELAIIAGKTGTKKSWITLDLALDAYINQGMKVYFTSIEMSSLELQHRMAGLIGHFNPNVFREDDEKAIKSAMTYFKMNNDEIKTKTTGEFIIPKTLTNTVYDIMNDIETYEPDIVFVDSFYLLLGSNGKPIENDYQEMGNTIAMFKNIAREKDIPFITNSQLVRNASENPDAEEIAYAYSLSRTSDLIVATVTQEETGIIDKNKLSIMKSRHTNKNNFGFVEFNWRDCTISEWIPPVLRGKDA